MEAVRESWTDDRLDDLANRMDRGFDRVDKDIRDLRGEMNTRFEGIEKRLDSLQRTMIWFSGSLFVAIFGLMVTVMLGQ